MKQKERFYVDTPLYKLEYTARVCQRYYLQFFKEKFSHLDITLGEHCVMDTIVHCPDITQIELARMIFKGRAHVTQLFNSLEAKGYIKRSVIVKNGRKAHHAELTPAGREIYTEIKVTSDKKFSKMFEYFEKKEDVFVKMLSEIQEILTEGETVKFD